MQFPKRKQVFLPQLLGRLFHTGQLDMSILGRAAQAWKMLAAADYALAGEARQEVAAEAHHLWGIRR